MPNSSISVVIAAAGQGKRFYSESLETPKPLFYFKTKPIIAHLIDVYRELSNNIIVAVASNQLGMLLKAWLLDYYKNPNWLKIIEQKEAVGTNNIIDMAKPFIDGKCIISWSDFLLDKEEFISIIENNKKSSLFFTGDISCRFGNIDGKIVQKQSNPGFVGIYYFDKLPELDLSKEDFIENFIGQKVNTEHLNIINLGTVCDLVKNKAFEKKSNRFFNKVVFTENEVFKYANNTQSIDLQKKEVNWYNNCPTGLKKYVPDYRYVEKENLLMLERILGKPISECKLDTKFWKEKLPKLLNELHQPAKIQVDEEACVSTYITKAHSRSKEVERTIDVWFGKSKVINGIDFSDWKFPDPPKDLIPKRFTFIHGDLQFSNSMLDNNGNIKILDPRGYFGNTILYGDPAYDIAKLLYAVDAYHKINEGKFSINKLNNGNTVLIHEPDLQINDDIRWFFNWACDNYEISKEKLNFLLFSIWLSLTSYIIDNPLAVVASYCKALIRSKRFLI